MPSFLGRALLTGIACLSVWILSVQGDKQIECAVCEKVIKSSKNYGKENGLTLVEAYKKYCALKVLDTEDAQFCYNLENMGADMHRILGLTSDEKRICKKVNKMNTDFCKQTKSKGGASVQPATIVEVNAETGTIRRKRGVIYE